VKVINKIVPVLIFVLFFVSCQKGQGSKMTKPPVVEEKAEVQKLQHVQVEIKGMTCEIGCAKLIQSKLYKADGVTFARISFEDSSGVVSFDENRITKDQVSEIIEKTAGGDIYTVVNIETIDAIESGSETQ